jgi:arginase family enzyme
VPHEHVALVGARDLDPAERAFLERYGIPLIDVAAVHRQGAQQALAEAFERPASDVDGIYFHLDLDVLDPSVAYVNQYQAPDGLEVDEVEEIIRAATARLPLKAAAVTAYDAGHDPDDSGAEAALRLIDCLIEAAAERKLERV